MKSWVNSYLFKGHTISVGDKFYHNNRSTKIGATLPDYLIITKIQEDWPYCILYAKYENHYVHTAERMLSDIILYNSNLDPECEKPEWIFVNKGFEKGV